MQTLGLVRPLQNGAGHTGEGPKEAGRQGSGHKERHKERSGRAEAGQHAVQFYDSEQFLASEVGDFVSAGLDAGQAVVIIATEAHRQLFCQQLILRGCDVDGASTSGRLVMLDARETLAKFMRDGVPDWGLFRFHAGAVLDRARNGRPQKLVRAYGEMVNLLWEDGNPAAAVRLEELWNDLAREQTFALLCGYAMNNFGDGAQRAGFEAICHTHTHVSPTEQYDQSADPDVLLEQVSLLQQRARVLEREVERSKELETALREALSHQRESERQLRSSQEELTDFFENAAECLHRVGADGVILAANRAELELLGYRRDEYVGHHVVEFHADREVAQEILAQLARNETVRDREARLRCKDGTIRHVLISSNVLFRDGRFVHSRCFTRDITDRKALEEELRQQNEDLSRTVRFSETFVGILGHDLRNPLSGITTAAALLARRADSDRVAKPAVRILNSGRRMARMIDQLLDFTRIRLGRGLPLERKAIDLAEVCRLAVDEIDEVVDGGSRPTIDLRSAGDVIGAWDADRLSQLVSNLLGNALTHGEPSVGVQIQLDGTQPDMVQLQVLNAGCIPDEVRDVIFEPFKHPGDRKQERSSGLGLGLYISQQIVVAHAGTIAADSSVAAGTRITVRLPRAVGKAEASFPTSLPEAAE